jgi:hypothetical protein
MKYGVNYILVKSNWFDPQLEKTKMLNIKSEGLLVYLTLFKFKLFDYDKNKNTFVTSINMLAKEIPNRLKFSKDDICEIVRHLQKEKVIKITNVSNWNSQMYRDGKVDYDRVLMIDSTDHPQTFSVNENGKWTDKPVSEDDYWIAVHAPMIQEFLSDKYKFDEKYIVLLVLMQKYHRTTNGFYMSMEKMEHVTGIGKNVINRMTWKMYENKLLAAYRRENGKGEYYHEYHICGRTDDEYIKDYLSTHEGNIDKWINKLKNKRDRQGKKDEVKSEKVDVIENKMKQGQVVVESQINVPTSRETRHTFGTKKAQVKNEYDLTENIDDLDEFEKLLC